MTAAKALVDSASPQITNLVAIAEARARAASNVTELVFSVANDAYDILGFRQALVFAGDASAASLTAVSGLARPTEDSPYLVWLNRTWPWLHARAVEAPGWLTIPTEPAEVVDGWGEWWPEGVFAIPLNRRSGERFRRNY